MNRCPALLVSAPASHQGKTTDPAALAALLRMPAGAEPVAVLCIGRVPAFPPRPVLEEMGWGGRLPVASLVYVDRWPHRAEPTPTAY